MSVGLVGRKCGMTRIFRDNGDSVPVTVIEALPNRVTTVKTAERDGYSAVQVTVGAAPKANRTTKPEVGHFANAKVDPGRGLYEFRLGEGEGAELKPGAELKVDLFNATGQPVDIGPPGIVYAVPTDPDGTGTINTVDALSLIHI